MYEIFEQLLQSNGISAYKFCKETGVSQSTISTWKKKNSKCGMDLASIVANYFNVTIDYLMNGGLDMFTKEELLVIEDALKIADEKYIKLLDESKNNKNKMVAFNRKQKKLWLVQNKLNKILKEEI